MYLELVRTVLSTDPLSFRRRPVTVLNRLKSTRASNFSSRLLVRDENLGRANVIDATLTGCRLLRRHTMHCVRAES